LVTNGWKEFMNLMKRLLPKLVMLKKWHQQGILMILRRHWVALIGVAAAITAFWATQQYAQDRVNAERDKMLPRGGLVEVLVAARELQPGERLSAENLAVRQIPREWALSDSVSPSEFELLDQAILVHRLTAGSPVMQAHLQMASSNDQPTVRLEAGYRAISIPVDEVSSVGGFIRPGDRVDLWAPTPMVSSDSNAEALAMMTSNTPGAHRPARLIASNLKVIATGQRLEGQVANANANLNGNLNGNAQESFSYASLTLAVPASIAAIVLGEQLQGRLSIALRGPPLATATVTSVLTNHRYGIAPPVEILIGGIEGEAP
jgi:Flp pilus assembly protein CpaB